MAEGLRRRPARSPEVMWKRLGTEVVTLHRRTHQYHVLNAAAGMIFGLASGDESVETIATKVAEAFGIDAKQALEDTRETVAGMEKLGLLVPDAAAVFPYERPRIREVTEKEFGEAVAEGATLVCRSLLG